MQIFKRYYNEFALPIDVEVFSKMYSKHFICTYLSKIKVYGF